MRGPRVWLVRRCCRNYTIFSTHNLVHRLEAILAVRTWRTHDLVHRSRCPFSGTHLYVVRLQSRAYTHGKGRTKKENRTR